MASYNAVHGTDFKPSDITQIHAEDLGVCDTDKYTYILTYSFPCTDLSSAGKGAGMAKGSGTRSGLLWEVERLLNEMDELPQILLMENVPQVVGKKNKADFAEWIAALDRLGYTNKYTIMNATDYGVPQNRKRCFMVSWLGDYYFDFPAPIPLHKRLKDVLEPHVDESYYLPDEVAARLLGDASKRERETTRTIRTGGRGALIDTHGISCVLMNRHEIGRQTEIAATLLARDYKGLSNHQMTTGVAEMGGRRHIHECDHMNGRIYDESGASPALRANSGGHNEIKIAIPQATKRGYIECAVGGAVDLSYPNSKTRRGRVQEGGTVSPTIMASNNELCVIQQKDNVANNQVPFRFRKLTPRECWRLTDFDDEDFDRAAAVNSKTQLYKQAGNSIVVNCLVAIFGQMIEGKENIYKERKEPKP